MKFVFDWKEIMKTITIALLLLGIFYHSFVNAASDSKDYSQNLTSQFSQQLTDAQEEAKLLKVELQLIKSYQDNLLSTVYWSLGVLATIAVLLIGFGWFANFRIYERDKVALSQELRITIAEEVNRIEGGIPILVEEKSQAAFSPFQQSMKEDLIKIKMKLSTVSQEIKQLEHHKWVSKEVYANALSVAVDMLRSALSMKMDSKIPWILDLIQGDLEKMLGSQTEMISMNVSELTKLLDSVDQEHLITVNKIRSLLSNIRIMSTSYG